MHLKTKENRQCAIVSKDGVHCTEKATNKIIGRDVTVYYLCDRCYNNYLNGAYGTKH